MSTVAPPPAAHPDESPAASGVHPFPDLSAEVTGTVPDPRSAPPIRWGILGAGGIASSFA